MATVLSATESVTPMTILHPLASLRPDEVTRARDIVALHNAGKDIVWKIIAVKEPNKEAVVKYVPISLVNRVLICTVSLKPNILDGRPSRLLESSIQTSTSGIHQISMRPLPISPAETSYGNGIWAARFMLLVLLKKWSVCTTSPRRVNSFKMRLSASSWSKVPRSSANLGPMAKTASMMKNVSFRYLGLLIASLRPVLLLSYLYRSQEEASLPQPLRPSSRLFVHCRRRKRGGHPH